MNNKKDNIFSLLKKEKKRQKNGVELIASENYVSKDILKVLGSVLTNKYAEGYPGKRYYGGCENIDQIESIAIKEGQKLFNTNYELNVQPHSGSSANMAVYLAVKILTKKDKIKVLGMSLNDGGHLTHGAFPSFSGKKYNLFDSYSYGLNKSERIDLQKIKEIISNEEIDLLIVGASAYSREIDFQKIKDILKYSKNKNIYLMVDIAHIAGLVATNNHSSPFGIADFVTSTTHKTLRGPRGGIIFSKNEELGKIINSVIFPGIQGGPLENVIGAKAICFIEAQSNKYKKYIKDVIKNTKLLENIFTNNNIDIVSGGSDNHLLLINLHKWNTDGKEIEENLEEINITVNKNSIPGDSNPTKPNGIRIGLPAITSRGFSEEDLGKIGKNVVYIIKIIDNINNKEEGKEKRKLIEAFQKEKRIIKKEIINISKKYSIYPNI